MAQDRFAEESAIELPDREAMSLVGPNVTPLPLPVEGADLPIEGDAELGTGQGIDEGRTPA
jgi:hypothetical protein